MKPPLLPAFARMLHGPCPQVFAKAGLGLALILGGCRANPPANPAPPVVSAATPSAPGPTPKEATATATHPPTPASSPSTPPPTNPSTTPATATPAPPAAKPPPELPIPAQEVLRLSQTAVGEAVVVAYVETLKEPFTLNADQVIYLSDLGLGSPVITALLKKSGQASPAPSPAKATPAAAAPEPAATSAPASPTAATPAPTEAVPNTASNPAPALAIPGAPAPAPAPPVYGPGQATAPAQAAPVVVAAPPQAVTQATFYDSLAPYGNWVLVEPYGWCWQPAVVAVSPAWQPYCDGGNWVWTDYGWYWHSTYTWGWAPFHYGRWHRSARLGWVWAPGYDWGPAWVSWRYSNAHCGWAPLPPECRWSAGVGFSWVSGGVGVSVGFGIFDDCWYACSWNRFRDPHLSRWRLDRPHVNQFVRDSKVAVGGDRSINVAGNNNTVIVNNGLPIDQVQRHSRDEVRKHAVADAASPEDAQRAMRGSAAARPEVAVYRPRIAAEGDRAPAPPESVLRRQESRKSPGITTSSLPGRPSAGLATTPPNAMAPVPGILGATAPAASRPAPARTMGPAAGPSTTPSSGAVPTRPSPGASPGTQGPTATPSRPGRPEPAPVAKPAATTGKDAPSSPVAPLPARPNPARPTTSYPGDNVGVPARTAPASRLAPQPAAGGPAAAPSFTPAAPSRPASQPLPGNALPQRPGGGASPEGIRGAPPRYPGANVSAPARVTPAPPVNPSPNVPAARPAVPAPRYTPAPTPHPVPAQPALAPRPEPRAFTPAPVAPTPFTGGSSRPMGPTYHSPAAMPSAAPRGPAAPPITPAAPAPSFRPEPPRPAPGRGSPSDR